jgi:hypothetical protein
MYSNPNSLDTLKSVYVTISNIKYIPRECPDRDTWNRLNESTATTSDIPEWYYETEGQIGFYPKFSSSGNTITIEYELKRKNLSISDYTTGTITSIANGATTVTGSGTTWTSKMNGFWICITDSATANTGDGVWYQIDTVNSTTELSLLKPYEGLSISVGTAAYTIGQCSLLPEDFQILPIWMACQIYFTSVHPDSTKSQLYKNLYNEGIKRLEDAFSDKGSSPVIEDRQGVQPNPNLFLSL